MTKSFLAILILLSNEAFAADAASFGRGGTYLTESSYLQAITNAPTNLVNKGFLFELNISANASQSLLDLSQEDPNIDPGTYDQRISPYYGTANFLGASAGIGIGYKGFTVFPKLMIGSGEALLNNPVYPEASASIKLSEGYAIGYATKINNWIAGASFVDLNTKNQINEGKVLEYSSGLVETISEEKDQIYNLGIGYEKNNYKISTNYQHSTLYSYRDRFNIGGEYNFKHVTVYADLQDTQTNNFENMTHLGLSYTLGYLKLNAGLNQFYPTYGIGFDSKYFKIYASYGGKNQYEQYRKEYKDYSVSIIFSNY